MEKSFGMAVVVMIAGLRGSGCWCVFLLKEDVVLEKRREITYRSMIHSGVQEGLRLHPAV